MRTYWGLSHKKAVTTLASALQGIPFEVLRLFELEGVKYRDLPISDKWQNVKRKLDSLPVMPGFVSRENHKTVYLNKDLIPTDSFAPTVAHESVHVFVNIIIGGFQKGIPDEQLVDQTIKNEFENKKKLNDERKINEVPVHFMNFKAMENIWEFPAEALRGAWGVHHPGIDPRGYSGARLRDYAKEYAPKTIQYFDAHLQALRDELKKDQNHVPDIRAVRKNAKSILAYSEKTTTHQQGESSKTISPQINDPDAIRSASPSSQDTPAPLSRDRKEKEKAGGLYSASHEKAVRTSRPEKEKAVEGRERKGHR